MEGNFIRRFIMLALIGIIVQNSKIETYHVLGSTNEWLFVFIYFVGTSTHDSIDEHRWRQYRL